MRLVIAAIVLSLGCSSKVEEVPKESASTRLRDRLDGLAGKARSVGGDVATKARTVGEDVVHKASEVADRAGELSGEALASGKRLKEALRGTGALAKLDFDLAIDATPESEADHAARLAGMKQVKVGAYTVGVAQNSMHPMNKLYKWQFRITWRVLDGRAVRLSLFTNSEIPELELASTLLDLVPLAERLLR